MSDLKAHQEMIAVQIEIDMLKDRIRRKLIELAELNRQLWDGKHVRGDEGDEIIVEYDGTYYKIEYRYPYSAENEFEKHRCVPIIEELHCDILMDV